MMPEEASIEEAVSPQLMQWAAVSCYWGIQMVDKSAIQELFRSINIRARISLGWCEHL